MKLTHILTVLALSSFVAPIAMAKAVSKRPRNQKETVIKSDSSQKRGAKASRAKTAKPPVEARKRHQSGSTEA